MKRFLLSGLLLIGCNVSASPAEAPPELKGLRLGMTLEQVHEAVYGPQVYREAARTEKGIVMVPAPAGYFGYAKDEASYFLDLQAPTRIPLTIAGEPAKIECRFLKVAGPKKNAVLISIEARFNARSAADAIAGLSAKFGSPQPGKITEWLNERMFQGTTQTWRIANGRYEVCLAQYDLKTSAELTLIDLSLARKLDPTDHRMKAKDL